MNNANTPKLPKITARKWNGDDAYSWAVFLDGRNIVAGLTRSEVNYHKRMVLKGWCEKNSVDYKEAAVKLKLIK